MPDLWCASRAQVLCGHVVEDVLQLAVDPVLGLASPPSAGDTSPPRPNGFRLVLDFPRGVPRRPKRSKMEEAEAGGHGAVADVGVKAVAGSPDAPEAPVSADGATGTVDARASEAAGVPAFVEHAWAVVHARHSGD